MDLIFPNSGYLDADLTGYNIGRLKRACLLILVRSLYDSLSFNEYIRKALATVFYDAFSYSYLLVFLGFLNNNFRIQYLALHYESTVLLLLRSSVEQSQITPEISTGVIRPDDIHVFYI